MSKTKTSNTQSKSSNTRTSYAIPMTGPSLTDWVDTTPNTTNKRRSRTKQTTSTEKEKSKPTKTTKQTTKSKTTTTVKPITKSVEPLKFVNERVCKSNTFVGQYDKTTKSLKCSIYSNRDEHEPVHTEYISLDQINEILKYNYNMKTISLSTGRSFWNFDFDRDQLVEYLRNFTDKIVLPKF